MADEWGPLEEMRTIYFEWVDDPKPGQRYLNSNSLSGGERNRIFFRRDGNYADFSLVSGADFREDGRGFVLFDFDRDGWLDLGVTSPNHPRFRIVRNTIGDQPELNKNQFVEVSLVGGQTSAEVSSQWSPRDAFGARVLVTTGDEKRMFQLSCGEGLSGVNAQRIHIGMGTTPAIDKLEVLWPSGKRTVRENIAAGERITIFENPEMQSVKK
jgi:hypothetical protein